MSASDLTASSTTETSASASLSADEGDITAAPFGDSLAEPGAESTSDPTALHPANSDSVGTFRRKRLTPGQWDGRVAGLSLKQYRELKWGLDNSFAKVQRNGPSWSMRPRIPQRSQSGPNVLLSTDVYKSFNATQPHGPSYSMGRQPIAQEGGKSTGPSLMVLKGIIGSGSHPTIPKDLGRQFGRERLSVTHEKGPAPGDYDVSCYARTGRYKRGPTPVIQGREAWHEAPTELSPACGEYKFEDYTRIGKDTSTRWTIQGRNEMAEPPSGAAAERLQRRCQRAQKQHGFERELQFEQVAPILLALDSPALMEIFKKLEDKAHAVRDPNIFLVSAAMQRLGNGGGHGARKPVLPGPPHYHPPPPLNESPKWRFGTEHRGLVV